MLAPDLAEDFPGLRSVDAVRHNLPVVRSSFIGRQLELEEVCERVRRVQFVTLTGIGGCGKTRLALEAAARLVEWFPQGVFLVSLAVLSDGELVGQALASALGLHLLDTDMEDLRDTWRSVGCSSCSTTASICWTPAPTWSMDSWLVVPTCT